MAIYRGYREEKNNWYYYDTGKGTSYPTKVKRGAIPNWFLKSIRSYGEFPELWELGKKTPLYHVKGLLHNELSREYDCFDHIATERAIHADGTETESFLSEPYQPPCNKAKLQEFAKRCRLNVEVIDTESYNGSGAIQLRFTPGQNNSYSNKKK